MTSLIHCEIIQVGILDNSSKKDNDRQMNDVAKNYIFKLCRFIFRCFTPHYRICYTTKHLEEPAVYLVHHQNLKGPLLSMAWFDRHIRPWVLSVFCKQSSCFRHYYEYTFTKRFGMPKFLAAVVVYPLSFCVSALMNVIRAIPVYRGSKDILKTFKESINALIGGHNILISPDIDYTSKSTTIGELYKGFLNLERLYFEKTGKHLAFVPLHIKKSEKCILVGKPVYFNTNNCTNKDGFKKEKEQAYARLKQEFLHLEKLRVDF